MIRDFLRIILLGLVVVGTGCFLSFDEFDDAGVDDEDTLTVQESDVSSEDVRNSETRDVSDEPDVSDEHDVSDEPDVSNEPDVLEQPFAPTDVPGLSLYFDAGQSESLTTSPEGLVSVWRDLSGHENHAYQSSDRLMPVYRESGQAGRGVLEFDGSYLTTSDPIQLRATEQGYTIFAVALSTVADGVEGNEGRTGILIGNYRRPHASFAVELHHDRRLRHWWDRREDFDDVADGNRGDAIFEEPRPAQDAFAMLTFSLDTTAQTVSAAVDGEFAEPLPDDGFVYEVERPLRIGADYREQNLPTAWKGSIGALLVYDRLLSEAEMGQVHQYLSQKWDVPLRN